jgi:colicin import membrane protein
MMAPDRMQHVSSGGLALLVHGFLVLGLMVGVSWKNPPQLPIEADLWVDLPERAESSVLPALDPALMPPAPLPEPESAPALAPPSVADIALEKVEKKKQAELLRQAELDRLEKVRLDKAQALQAAQVLAEQVEQIEKEKAEKAKRDQSRHQIDQDVARQMREELDAESSQLRALHDRSKAGRQTRVVRDFQERIRGKIRDSLVMPQNLRGDSEVIFQVSLLPNGEVLRVVLVRTSGQSLYDSAVERAIFKASPLPLPNEREAAAQFRDGLTLKFRPSEDGSGLH